MSKCIINITYTYNHHFNSIPSIILTQSLPCIGTSQTPQVHSSIQVSHILINNMNLKHSIKNILHNKNTLHNFNCFNIRILHRTICISNINYTLTQTPSLFKVLGLSLASLLVLWLLIHFKYNFIECHTKSFTIVHVFYARVVKL